MKERILFSFFNFTKQKIPRRYFLFVLERAFKALNVNTPVELSLILVGQNRIKELNTKFRKVNRATDVLSFPIETISQQKNKSERVVLGDIYICPQYIIGKFKPRSLKKELALQFIHGVMHLLGYDHEEDQRTWDKTEKMIYESF